jgi:dTDP-4-amino-4,6-dideoxygalactose transaminase
MGSFFKKLASRFSLLIKKFYAIPYCVPAWRWAEHLIILRCLLTGKLIEGPHKKMLCKAIASKTKKKYVFGFNSGADAIYAALKTRHIGRGDKAILPSYCCESVVQAVVRTGADPVFCDMNEEYNPDVKNIVGLIDEGVKAIIFPHLFGNPADIDKMEDVLSKSGQRSKVLLIDDAAQAFGARLNSKLVGTFGDVGVISFGPGKIMIASGGGLLITDSDEISEGLQQLRTENHPVASKLKRLMYFLVFRRWRRFTLPFYFLFRNFFQENEFQQHHILRLCNVDAAIGLKQLNRLETMLKIRLERKEQLDRLFSSDCDHAVEKPAENARPDKKLNVATKYVFRMKSKVDHEHQQRYRQIMLKNGIELFDLYSPLHKNPQYGDPQKSLPVTERFYDQILQLPVEPSINRRDFNKILKIIYTFLHDPLFEKAFNTGNRCFKYKTS